MAVAGGLADRWPEEHGAGGVAERGPKLLADGIVVPPADDVALAEEAELLAAGREVEDKLGEGRMAEVGDLVALAVADDPEGVIVVGTAEGDGAGARHAIEGGGGEAREARAGGVVDIEGGGGGR